MELQVQIDDVSSCPGRCPGCVLSADERKVNRADMHDEHRIKAIARVGEYARQLRPDSLNVSWGIADHLMLGADYVKTLYQETAEMMMAAGFDGESGSVFFSASLIANQRIAREQIETLSSIEKVAGIELIPIVVLDPQNLRHKTFGPQWHQYAELANQSFGRIDLAMNLSDVACHLMTPDELVQYAKQYHFHEVTVNWTPTHGNLVHTASDMKHLGQWLLDFAKLADAAGVSYSYGPVMQRAAGAAMCGSGEGSLARDAQRVIDTTIRHSIHIDADGSLYPKFEAIGDVPHSPRFEYERLGSVLDEPISAILDRSMPLLARRVVREVISDPRCNGCEHVRACNLTGFHVYGHVLDAKFAKDHGRNEAHQHYGSRECPHVAKMLWDYAFSKLEDPAHEK